MSAETFNNEYFSNQIDRIATEYAEEIATSEPPNPLIPDGISVEKHKNDFLKAVEMKEHRELMFKASQIVYEEGKSLLSEEEWEALSKDLNQAARRLAEIDEDIDLDESLYSVLGFSHNGIRAIQKLMQIKYKEKNFNDVLALNALLTTLCPEIPEFWLYLGIAYQEMENYQRALMAYAYCHIIDVENIPAWVFSAECYINEMLLDDAEVELNEAKRLIEQYHCEEVWKDSISDLDKAYRTASRTAL